MLGSEYKAVPNVLGNTGFDNTFVKYASDGKTILDVVVNETKPLQADGSVLLNKATESLPAQMSDKWLKSVADRLLKSGDADSMRIADWIIERGARKTVTGVGVQDGVGKVMVGWLN